MFGRRGTGKSTRVKYNFPEAVYLDLPESDIYTDLPAQPGNLENFIPPRFQHYIIIDEIRRVPELLNEAHRLIESKSYKFIMLGSGDRKLRRKGVNLLACRALSYFMHPLTVKELKNDFDLSRSLKFGHLPMAYTDQCH